jgi:ABC-type uncharacterized transport system ATPase subunit
MNKRIKELEKQCWSHYVNGVLIDGHLHFDVEKFAELIIEECVEQGKIIQSQSIVNGSEEYVAGREMGIEVFMNQIKQHFGDES